MVKWIGKNVIALETLEGSLDGHVADVRSERRTKNKSVSCRRGSGERQTRGETALDPNTPENRERCNTAQVNNDESLYSFRDHLTTLMFIVARETHKSPFSSENGYPAYTFQTARTVFVELFCTPESTMENRHFA